MIVASLLLFCYHDSVVVSLVCGSGDAGVAVVCSIESGDDCGFSVAITIWLIQWCSCGCWCN
jgi:hypothetical protein